MNVTTRGLSLLFVLLAGTAGQPPPSPTQLVVALLADGGGIRSEITFTNPSADSEGGVLIFRRSSGELWDLSIDGQPSNTLRYDLPSAGGFRVNTGGEGPVQSGYATIRPDSPNTAIRASITYQLGEFQVSVPAVPPHHQFHLVVEKTAKSNTGIALANPYDQVVQLHLRLFDQSGRFQNSRRRDLDPRQHTSVFVDELFPGLGNFLGTLHLVSSRPVGGLGLRQQETGSLSNLPAGPDAFDGRRDNFGSITLDPIFELNGSGSDIDSLAFWEAPDPADTLLLVTAKNNRLIEVWPFPFTDESEPITDPFGEGDVNGVVVDQESDLLFVSQAQPSSQFYTFSLPDLTLRSRFGEVELDLEPNLDLLELPDSRRLLLVTAGRLVHAFEISGFQGQLVNSFDPEGINRHFPYQPLRDLLRVSEW